MNEERRSTKKVNIDALFKRDNYEPPKINFERAAEKAIRDGTARIDKITYEAIAKELGMKNSNNIAKWYDEDSLSFTTLKMMMYVLNCKIDDLIDPPKPIGLPKKKNKKS